METTPLERMLSLILKKDMAVLATAQHGEPHASLMAYLPEDGGRRLYLATGTDSRKYRNITESMQVSLLIDTREDATCPEAMQPRAAIQALTVSGRISHPAEEETTRLVPRFLERHPHMQAFLAHPDTVLLCVDITGLLLMDGVTDATFVDLQDAPA